ncbi:MAG: trypsin-like peptidase domain-containing protein [Acholeplasma sp.]|nr:trypsin-like peptidase domain-containing protein [Acholeplasma sp.]
MTKRILKIIIMIVITLSLVSCVSFNKDNVVAYEAATEYEKLVIDTYSKVSNITVAIIKENYDLNGDFTNQYEIGNGVVYKKDAALLESTYYAITSANILKDQAISSLKVAPSSKTSKVNIINYAINEKYGIAIIVFKTQYKLTVVDLESITPSYLKSGQTIVSIATNSNMEVFNGYHEGMITNNDVVYNNVDSYAFTHDAANNAGEIGSGVFDLSGNLVGINVEKKYHRSKTDTEYNVLGLNIAIKSNVFIKAILNISEVDFQSKLIPNTYFNVSNEISESNINTDYEETIIGVNSNVNNSVVRLVISDKNGSGIIYKKVNNDYYILTKNFNAASMKVYYDNKEYESLKIYEVNANIAVVVVRTNDVLSVYNSRAINNKEAVPFAKGQTVLLIGSVNDEFINSINSATLSKENYQNEFFMHDGSINLGQEGAPIFNLKGELMGIHLSRLQTVETVSGEIIAEGINYAYNINYIANKIDDLNKIDDEALPLVSENVYESTVSHEKAIIDVIDKRDKASVTISTLTGHGSGIIYKKESYQGSYRYYVMTNHHVIENSEDVRINFSDGRNPVLGKDMYSLSMYDVGVVRFISDEDYDVYTSDVIALDSQVDFKIGQTVVSIGTPVDIDNKGYVTMGNIVTNPKTLGIVGKLAISHDGAINPGNSGGPAFNLKGELLGLNVSKTTFFQTIDGDVFAERVGTSLNLNLLSKEVYAFRENSYISIVRPAKIGITVSAIEDFITKDTPQSILDLLPREKDGLLVLEVDVLRKVYGKLFEYDLIIKFDGYEIKATNDLAVHIENGRLGDKHQATILRKVGNTVTELTIEIELS